MATEEGGNSGFVVHKRKKGLKQVTYKCEKIKKARVEGEEYVNYSGKTVSKKYIGNPCR